MKKLIAAIVIASIGAAFADPYYVYDYKASIKRLDISAKYANRTVTQKYNVKSDTIQGYVTIPVCQTCSANGTIVSSLGIANDGYAYLTLKGNSKLVAGKEYQILKAPVKASIGVFGGDQEMDGRIVDVKKVTKAWMALDFPMDLTQFGTGTLVAKKDLSQGVPLGFFGLTNLGENQNRVDVQNTGFGTTKVIKGTASFCGGNGDDCLSVGSISGTLVGYPMYLGACDHTPMWNLCNVTPTGEIPQAVICGSWSLKYNSSLTEAYAASGESAIIKKFSKASTYLEIDAAGNVKSSK